MELEKLPSGFYSEIADYFRKLREEGRMLDKRTVKARLLRNEVRNVKRMVREITRVRHRKLLKKATKGEKVLDDFLTAEESRLMKGIVPLTEAYQTFTKNLLRGHLSQIEIAVQNRSAVLRFLKDVPAIIGADMKPYGPFKSEDVASLPIENAKILVKQGLADEIEAI